MSMILKIKRQLDALGFRRGISKEVEKMGAELTICQMIVVVLSISSVVFLFLPIFYLQSPTFIAVFLGLSLLSLFGGVWFWIHKAEICEHPEEVEE